MSIPLSWTRSRSNPTPPAVIIDFNNLSGSFGDEFGYRLPEGARDTRSILRIGSLFPDEGYHLWQVTPLDGSGVTNKLLGVIVEQINRGLGGECAATNMDTEPGPRPVSPTAAAANKDRV